MWTKYIACWARTNIFERSGPDMTNFLDRCKPHEHRGGLDKFSQDISATYRDAATYYAAHPGLDGLATRTTSQEWAEFKLDA